MLFLFMWLLGHVFLPELRTGYRANTQRKSYGHGKYDQRPEGGESFHLAILVSTLRNEGVKTKKPEVHLCSIENGIPERQVKVADQPK